MNHPESNHQQIIIIKRGNSEEDGHHGGAWKIAFADFMTAMMALFLVLWLINAANEETKRAVASYFNPVKLVDRNRSSKGINEQGNGPTTPIDKASGGSVKNASQTDETKGAEVNDHGQSTLESDARFFASPLSELEKIVNKEKNEETLASSSPVSDGEMQDENFADPFGPDFWSNPSASLSPPSMEDVVSNEVASTATSQIGPMSEPKSEDPSKENSKADLAAKLLSEIQKDLKSAQGNSAGIGKAIDIKPVDEGILISVSDELETPMFKIGSAVPEAPLVGAVAAIAKLLLTQTGSIHVSGHTDARKYKNEAEGNWRLSTDRAKASYFMLLRGGLSSDRVVEIAGFADRKLRNIDDPLAAQNRRIEILLEVK